MQLNESLCMNMKPLVRGKNIYLREVTLDDAQFILDLRTDPAKGKHLSKTSPDLQQQQEFINQYHRSREDFYFIICDWADAKLGTVRIYDIQGDSFCWGSWILKTNSPTSAAVESALLIYDFSFFSLHYKRSHFDVRKENRTVIEFHLRFGAQIVGETDFDFLFSYDLEAFLKIRKRYARYLPGGL
jgi:RimJ/RimL family protein N-acetyltransferase